MRMKLGRHFPVGLWVMIAACGYISSARAEDPRPMDLSGAVIVVSADNPIQGKAADMLSDEVFIRTGIRLPVVVNVPTDGPAIVLGAAGAMPCEPVDMPAGLDVPDKAEGYAIWTDGPAGEAPRVYLRRTSRLRRPRSTRSGATNSATGTSRTPMTPGASTSTSSISATWRCSGRT